MHISDLLQPCCVSLRRQVDSMRAAEHLLVGLLAKGGHLTDAAAFESDVFAREDLGGICVGGGLAIPHAQKYRRSGTGAGSPYAGPAAGL